MMVKHVFKFRGIYLLIAIYIRMYYAAIYRKKHQEKTISRGVVQ